MGGRPWVFQCVLLVLLLAHGARGWDVQAAAASLGVPEQALVQAAAVSGLEAMAVAAAVRHDPSARLAPSGALSYACGFPHHDHAGDEQQQQHADDGGVQAAAATAPAVLDDSAIPLDEAFRLHSRPGATRKIQLAFRGCNTTVRRAARCARGDAAGGRYRCAQLQTARACRFRPKQQLTQLLLSARTLRHRCKGTAWNTAQYSQRGGMATIVTPPYDADGDEDAFSDRERRNVIQIWAAVAQDFSIFDVDVTTADVRHDGIDRCEQQGGRVCKSTAHTRPLAPQHCGCRAPPHVQDARE